MKGGRVFVWKGYKRDITKEGRRKGRREVWVGQEGEDRRREEEKERRK